MRVERWSAARLRRRAGEPAELLTDTVAGGASVGFLAPLGHEEAAAWWRDRAEATAAGRLAVWAAVDDTGRPAGSVSLAHPDKPNSRHRAEVVTLMVHRSARGQGLGRRLLATAEGAAAAPDYAASPAGELRPTTLYFKRLAG